MRIFETEDSNRKYITYGIFKHYEKKPSGNSEIGLPLIVRKNCPKKRMKDFKAQGKSDCWKSFRQKVKENHCRTFWRKTYLIFIPLPNSFSNPNKHFLASHVCFLGIFLTPDLSGNDNGELNNSNYLAWSWSNPSTRNIIKFFL